MVSSNLKCMLTKIIFRIGKDNRKVIRGILQASAIRREGIRMKGSASAHGPLDCAQKRVLCAINPHLNCFQ